MTLPSSSGRSERASGDAPTSSSSFLSRLIHCWYYSIGILLLYVVTFVCWKYFPSRAAFVYGGIVTAGIMGLGMVWALRRGYFANRVDLAVHAYVIVDVLLEGSMYEVFRWIVGADAAAEGFVHQFHDNNNFFFCALTFVILIGGNRWYALHRKQAAQLSPAVVRESPAQEEAVTLAG